MAKFIAVYDGHTRKRLAYLQNAYGISYVKNTSTLWTGQFSLPYSDPKTKYCQAFNLVDIWDEDAGGKNRYVGLFRIMPRTEDTLGIDANIVYELEHVLTEYTCQFLVVSRCDDFVITDVNPSGIFEV